MELSAKYQEYDEQGGIIDKVIRSEWTTNDMDMSFVSVSDIAGITGTGFWKIGAASPGMMRVTPCGPDCVMPIQPGFHIQQSTAVLYRTWKSLPEVIQKFPFRSEGLDREASKFTGQQAVSYARPDHMDQFTWNGLAPQMQRMIGRRVNVDSDYDPGLFKSIEWQEYYVDDISI